MEVKCRTTGSRYSIELKDLNVEQYDRLWKTICQVMDEEEGEDDH